MCEYVRKVANGRDSLVFSPMKIDCQLKDSNPHKHDLEFLKEKIEEEICLNLTKFIRENLGHPIFRTSEMGSDSSWY